MFLRVSAFIRVFMDVLTKDLRDIPRSLPDSVSVITIPVALLRRVRISLHRKVILGGILSLSIFTIVVSIVRIAGAELPKGPVDSIWVNFWLQAGAAVAVTIDSIAA